MRDATFGKLIPSSVSTRSREHDPYTTVAFVSVNAALNSSSTLERLVSGRPITNSESTSKSN